MGAIYHSNGQMAWNGIQGRSVYHSNGQQQTQFGTGCRVNLGEGIVLSVSIESATLDVLGNYFELM